MTVQSPHGFKLCQYNTADGAADMPAADAYHYRWIHMESGQSAPTPDWKNTILFIPTPGQADFKVSYNNFFLDAGDTLTLNGQPGGTITAHGNGIVLLAGTNKGEVASNTTPVQKKYADHYKVEKPWGHELWLNGEDKVFNFKEVHLKAGNQTSLQYHKFKQETNLLFSGESDLIFKSNDTVDNDNVTPEDLGTIVLQPMTVMYIDPPTLHRLRARTDLYLYEAATPFLDDVFRVQDDAARGNGRIQTEHRKAS